MLLYLVLQNKSELNSQLNIFRINKKSIYYISQVKKKYLMGSLLLG